MGRPRQTVRGKMNPQNMNAAIPECRPATEEISGLIERITFHNDDSGFCVLRVKAHGQREETTVIGSLPSVTAGEWLSAEGWWVRDKELGCAGKSVVLICGSRSHPRWDHGKREHVSTNADESNNSLAFDK